MLKSDFNLPTRSGEVCSLDHIETGASAVIERVDIAGSGVGRRLLDLGLLPDTPIRVVRRAPLGDPVVYELRGYQLCLRRSEAAHIWVRRIANAHSEAAD